MSTLNHESAKPAVITITHHARGYRYIDTPDKVEGFIRAAATFAARYVPGKGWLVYDDKYNAEQVEYLLKTFFPLHTAVYSEIGEAPKPAPASETPKPVTLEAKIDTAVKRYERDSAAMVRESFPNRSSRNYVSGWDV